MLNPLLERKPIRLNKKQRTFLEYWVDPRSETFGNAYRSGLKAGFAPKYSLNITHLNPNWLSESIDKLELHPEHIKQGIQSIALNAPQSKSPDDTRLKAYETLARITGMLDTNNKVNVTVVQPILNGMSNPTEPPIKHTNDTHVVDSTVTDTKPPKK